MALETEVNLAGLGVIEPEKVLSVRKEVFRDLFKEGSFDVDAAKLVLAIGYSLKDYLIGKSFDLAFKEREGETPPHITVEHVLRAYDSFVESLRNTK